MFKVYSSLFFLIFNGTILFVIYFSQYKLYSLRWLGNCLCNETKGLFQFQSLVLFLNSHMVNLQFTEL